MAGRHLVALAVALLPATAHAAHPRALVLRDIPNWLTACPDGAPEEVELDHQGIPYDTVDSTAFATVDLHAYSMVLLAECQGDGTHDAWNHRIDDLEEWVRQGGFLSAHVMNPLLCGNFVQPELPGGTPTLDNWLESDLVVEDITHPAVASVSAPTGNPIASQGFPSTGDPGDRVILTGVDHGHPVLFERALGHGVMYYSSLFFGAFHLSCPPMLGAVGDAGVIYRDLVAYGRTFIPCGLEDSDGDSVGDVCDICDGGDDLVDTDRDGVPDACDVCPHLPAPDDADGDGICDDVDDSDGDGIVDYHDLCPYVYDPEQLDQDGDGYGDACDACPADPSPGPLMISWYVDADGDGQGVPSEPVLACARPEGRADNMLDCDDTDPYRRAGAPEVCDGIDNNCDGVVDRTDCFTADPPPPSVAPRGGCSTVPAPAGLILLLPLIAARRRGRGSGQESSRRF